MVSFLLPDTESTARLGELLGRLAGPGDVFCLDGDLGAGKTTLTQSIARGLGVDSRCYVTSPSFAIIHEYDGRLPLYHMDFYRLGGVDDALDLGCEEYFYGDGLCVIEWPERVDEILPESRIDVELMVSGEYSREVTFIARGGTAQLLERITQELREIGIHPKRSS